MFRTDLLSIIRSLNTVFTATGICHTSYVDLYYKNISRCTVLWMSNSIHVDIYLFMYFFPYIHYSCISTDGYVEFTQYSKILLTHFMSRIYEYFLISTKFCRSVTEHLNPPLPKKKWNLYLFHFTILLSRVRSHFKVRCQTTCSQMLNATKGLRAQARVCPLFQRISGNKAFWFQHALWKRVLNSHWQMSRRFV